MNAYEFIVKMKNYASSELKKVANELGVVDRKADQTFSKADRTARGFGGTLGGLRGKLIGLFAGVSIMGFTSQVIDARQEYEKFDAVLTNTFQNKDVGQGALAMLTDFAAKTPYQLNELTGSFIKLANRGVAPTYFEMTKLGDLASSQGKSFDQLTEAILDAQTGEFERMKEFGIRASKAGDKVNLSFKGVTKTVQMNDKAIKDAILSYGDMAGVAGSMDVISKTLGGRISNLKDQWWGFLVAVGGMSSGVFGDVISGLGDGVAFLTEHLPQISMWFEILWQNISPLANSIKEFIKAAFGISGTNDVMQTFGNIMSGILLVVDWFASGLSYMIDNLRPIAPELAVITAAVWLFNLAMYANPVGLIIAAIVAFITIIGLATKYTSGWGQTWISVKNIFKAVWNQIGITFDYYVERFKYNFDMIILKAKQVAESVSNFFSSGDNISNIVGDQIDKRQKDWANKQKQIMQETVGNAKTVANSVKNIGITVDTKGASNDLKKIKGAFNSATGSKGGNPQAYADYLNNQKKLDVPGLGGSAGTKGKNGTKDKADKPDGIVSGGSKQTQINITIGKLQDQTVIHVDHMEKGLSGLGDKVQEILLRAVNSVNQMQTS